MWNATSSVFILSSQVNSSTTMSPPSQVLYLFFGGTRNFSPAWEESPTLSIFKCSIKPYNQSYAIHSMTFGIPFIIKKFHASSLSSRSPRRTRKRELLSSAVWILLPVVVGTLGLKPLESLTLLNCRPRVDGRKRLSPLETLLFHLSCPYICQNSQNGIAP